VSDELIDVVVIDSCDIVLNLTQWTKYAKIQTVNCKRVEMRYPKIPTPQDKVKDD
jgi:hypothetical protein